MDKKKKPIRTSYPLRVSKNALQNIDEITGYIAFINHEPLNALKVGDAIFEKIEKISQNPFAYKECQELISQSKIYRQANCLAWQIIFKITLNKIIILGIIHHSRKPSNLKRLKNIK